MDTGETRDEARQQREQQETQRQQRREQQDAQRGQQPGPLLEQLRATHDADHQVGRAPQRWRRERREREREELTECILAAARDIAVQEGWQAVTIRKVADYVDYSPAALYEYFDSKEAILIELKRRAFKMLQQDLEDTWAEGGSAAQKIVAAIMAQWDFAWKHPELAQVMYGIGGIRCGMMDTPKERGEVYTAVKGKMESLLQEAGATKVNVDAAMVMAQASVVGFITLTMNDRIIGGRERARQLVLETAHGFLIAWGAADQ
jgi:AcrR family transcriptional regulator